ncbi:hypothetical protein FZC66_05710 [Priestia megaterium]|nr:hypothetical protein FZC66_05710 [Priestia megaterium]
MKRYGVFIASFVILLFGFEIVSGIFLTFTYVPDPSQAWSSMTHLSNEVSIVSEPNRFAFLIPVIAATISFILSKRIGKA